MGRLSITLHKGSFIMIGDAKVTFAGGRAGRMQLVVDAPPNIKVIRDDHLNPDVIAVLQSKNRHSGGK